MGNESFTCYTLCKAFQKRSLLKDVLFNPFSTFREMTFEHLRCKFLSADMAPHVNQSCREKTGLIFQVNLA